MRAFLKNFAVFVVLAVVFSNISGCGGSDTASNATIIQPTPVANGTASEASQYPLLAATAAESEIRSLDGSSFKIADKKGKVVLVNLWATWCIPCQAEMPALVRMQDKHREQGFEVIGLNADDEAEEDIKPFVANKKLNYPIGWVDSKLQRSLINISRSSGIPQSFLVDREGRLRGVFVGANPNDVRKMEELVAKVVGGEQTEMVEPDEKARKAVAPLSETEPTNK